MASLLQKPRAWRRTLRKFSMIIAAYAGLLGVARAAGPIRVLVLQEHGPGTASQAQPLLDSLLQVVAKLNDWPSVQGEFTTRRPAALQYIKEKNPEFAILSLESFLALRKDQALQVVGQVRASTTGGQRYFLVSKAGSALSDCVGKSVASDHLGNRRFIEQVVARGAFKLSDFTLQETRRPVQTLKEVIRDKAVCALIDDAQLASLEHVEGGKQLKAVWKSDPLPGMPVVAFKKATDEQTAQFKASLPKLCQGKNAEVCKKVGIQALKAAGEADYQRAVSAYGR
jgi:hypothetical protein